MNSVVYKGILEYLKDEKKVVEYLYILYYFFSKYNNSVKSYKEQFTQIDKQLGDVLEFFIEKRYSQKGIYSLLQYSIKETGYNILNVSHSYGINVSDIQNLVESDIIENTQDNDAGVYIKSADNKIYKRFLLEDVKKLIGI